jgi:hypothetical protein
MRQSKRLKPLTLYPLEVEESLSLFMRADSDKVEPGMRRLHHKKSRNGKNRAAGSRGG